MIPSEVLQHTVSAVGPTNFRATSLQHVGSPVSATIAARAGKIHDPTWNGPNPQPLTQLVAKVATILGQCVVGGHWPVTTEELDELQHLPRRHARTAHAHRLAVRVAKAALGSAHKDAVSFPVISVAVAPLPVVDFNAAMKGTRTERLEDLVHRLAHPRGA
eukprot:CAMPEP_0171061156 /NCGR_PEP_ID=MMETSP0766_2-20121228/4257_1 /TAXON_ID=439317 /ORGANISM="Gambierdiscus australes, Strain CAWD 149" /LENGTH=160 /DNA_ID=CAMNT_0011516795 /DNA_START=128 /DNA_END=609 /DNA_ORIENTATION=-